MIPSSPSHRGFTLVEMLLYLATAGLLFISASVVFTLVLQSRTKAQTIDEVEGVAMQAIQRMTQSLHNASSLSVPAKGANGSTVTMVMAADGHTVSFSLSGTKVVMTDAGVATDLTPSTVSITSLDFVNLAQVNTRGSIAITLGVSATSPSTWTQYSYSQTFYATASLRQ